MRLLCGRSARSMAGLHKMSRMRNGLVVEIEAETETPPGHDRRRVLVIAFAMCLAVASAFLGQDGPGAQSARDPTLALPTAAPSDVVLFTSPVPLANEPPPPLAWVPARVRTTEGLVTYARHPGEISILTWTELGTVYSLSSDRRNVDQLID